MHWSAVPSDSASAILGHQCCVQLIRMLRVPCFCNNLHLHNRSGGHTAGCTSTSHHLHSQHLPPPAQPAPPTTCTASTTHHLHGQHHPPQLKICPFSPTPSRGRCLSHCTQTKRAGRIPSMQTHTHTHTHTPLAPCPAISNHTGQLHDPTRTVIDGHLEPYESSVGSQPSLNAAAQRRSINVTTTQWNYNTASKGPRQLMRNAQHSGRELGLTSSPAAAG